jgi:hypothetical protein
MSIAIIHSRNKPVDDIVGFLNAEGYGATDFPLEEDGLAERIYAAGTTFVICRPDFSTCGPLDVFGKLNAIPAPPDAAMPAGRIPVLFCLPKDVKLKPSDYPRYNLSYIPEPIDYNLLLTKIHALSEAQTEDGDEDLVMNAVRMLQTQFIARITHAAAMAEKISLHPDVPDRLAEYGREIRADVEEAYYLAETLGAYYAEHVQNSLRALDAPERLPARSLCALLEKTERNLTQGGKRFVHCDAALRQIAVRAGEETIGELLEILLTETAFRFGTPVDVDAFLEEDGFAVTFAPQACLNEDYLHHLVLRARTTELCAGLDVRLAVTPTPSCNRLRLFVPHGNPALSYAAAPLPGKERKTA